MTSKRFDGPTPNGGAYSIAVWIDRRGNAVTKEEAVEVAITEYAADGTRLAETFTSSYSWMESIHPDDDPTRVY
jgi:hypothetical protein